MSCTQIRYPEHPEHQSWAVLCGDAQDLRDLIAQRRYWVRKNVKVGPETSRREAVLAQNFVITFFPGDSSYGKGQFLVEGSDGTAHVYVRGVPAGGTKVYAKYLQSILSVAHDEKTEAGQHEHGHVAPHHAPIGSIDLEYYDDTGNGSGRKNLLCSTHVQLGDKKDLLDILIFCAVTSIDSWVIVMNALKASSPRRTDKPGSVSPLPSPVTEFLFINPAGDRPIVVYSGFQDKDTEMDDPIPPACNPVTGMAEIDANNSEKMYVDIKMITYKAYPKPCP